MNLLVGAVPGTQLIFVALELNGLPDGPDSNGRVACILDLTIVAKLIVLLTFILSVRVGTFVHECHT